MTLPPRTVGAPVPTILASTLGPMDRLNSGANGTIYALKTFRLADEPGALAYKEYAGHARTVTLPGLNSIVAARLRLSPKRRKIFDDLTVWPLRPVANAKGQPTGVVMRLIPGDFMQVIELPSGKRQTIAREVQHLIYDASTARRRAVDVPSDRDMLTRWRICEQLAFAISLLHGADLVYGDLSARNVLYRMGGKPSVLLVDCDAARVRGSAPVNQQQNSPDWDPPEARPQHRVRADPSQTEATDRYKLSLFVLRSLTPGRDSSTNRDWRVAARFLDADGRKLMMRGLSDDPGRRPKAREWVDYLRAKVGDTPIPVVRGTAPTNTSGGWKRGPGGAWIPA